MNETLLSLASEPDQLSEGNIWRTKSAIVAQTLLIGQSDPPSGHNDIAI